MKRVFFVLFSLCLALSFCACSGDTAALFDSAATTSELVTKATENLLWDNVVYTDDAGEDHMPLDEIYFNHYYGAADTAAFYAVVESYCVAVQTQNSADEIGVFKVRTDFDEAAFAASRSDLSGDALTRAARTQMSANAEKNIETAQRFAQNRINIFLAQNESYDQKEYAKAQNARIGAHGYYVYYIISGDNAGIEKIITAQIDAKRI